MNTPRPQRDVRQAEEVGDQLAEIFEFAAERIAEYKQTPGKVVFRNASYPEVADLLDRRLRIALEDEIVPAVQTDNGKIRAYEVNREVIKKALVGLKGAALRRIAKEKNIPVSVGVVRLAESIAQAYGWNEDEIARLVLENEEDIRPERGHSSRFYPLRTEPDLDYVAERLRVVGGRYIRTGVAKWFVFERFDRSDDGALVLTGAVREYSASIDNRQPGQPTLHASPAPDSVARVVIDGSDLMVVEKASLSVAKATVLAADDAARISPLNFLPFIDTNAPAARGEIHDASRFMMDLLVNRLPAKGLGDVNLTVARFKLKPEGTAGANPDIERRASLKAVRFEGDYLFGSVQACQLIAVDQRPLSDMTLQVVLRDQQRVAVGRFPVRISIEPDHVSVETSFGATSHEYSAHVHKAVSEAVAAEIREGTGNVDRLEDFIDRVRRRAGADETGEHLDLLADI